LSIFEQRKNIKPYEYPELLEYMHALRHTMWFVEEYKKSMIRDVNDYNNKLNPQERQVIKRTLLAISNIEVSVKLFWSRVGDVMPKPEIYMVGLTCAHNEVIHSEAYSELLTQLGLDDEFKQLVEVPVIKDRIEYLTKYLKGAADNKQQNYVFTLLLFSIFIEAISLFSQFYIIKSFCQKKHLLKTIDNIVMATAKEELVHFQFGSFLINLIKKENPEWFNDEFKAKILRACKKGYIAELKIVDWIFEDGELDHLPKEEVYLFIQHKFNESLAQIGMEPIFEIDTKQLTCLKWFENEQIVDVRPDFFDIQSPNYTNGDQEISAESLFD
jgi:ribonucleoside-diphosphate reductase beta chain